MAYTKTELFVLPLAFLAMVGFAAFLRFVTFEKTRRIQDLPFFIIAVAVLIMEIIKQLRNLSQGYEAWSAPLHYCSTFFVWFPLAEFSKGKFRKRMQNVAFCASFCLLALFYFGPRAIIGNSCGGVFSSYAAFHTFFYHHLALFYCILGIVFKRFQPSETDGWIWIICTSAYLSIALVCSFVFEKNFFNILSSNVPFMESFRIAFGQIPYLFLLFSLLLFGGASIFWITARILEKRKIVNTNKKTVA